MTQSEIIDKITRRITMDIQGVPSSAQESIIRQGLEECLVLIIEDDRN